MATRARRCSAARRGSHLGHCPAALPIAVWPSAAGRPAGRSRQRHRLSPLPASRTPTHSRTRPACPGCNAHAPGFNSHAPGYGSHAPGFSSHTSGYGSHASGFSSHASGFNSHASGFNSHTSGFNSHTSGYGSHAPGFNSHASGFNSHASGYGSHTFGVNSHTSGFKSHARAWSSLPTGTTSMPAMRRVFPFAATSVLSGCRRARPAKARICRISRARSQRADAPDRCPGQPGGIPVRGRRSPFLSQGP
ncbi:MAG: hypothetical protein FAZ92_03733 [Accumulibacter sp.]|nr:MAG: hypothetical protein FAZ92_03733 [Accumulibacter sp.]